MSKAQAEHQEVSNDNLRDLRELKGILNKEISLLRGTWQFKGYYPEDCQAFHHCYLNIMDFRAPIIDLSERAFAFDTYKSFQGEECFDSQRLLEHIDWTWVQISEDDKL